MRLATLATLFTTATLALAVPTDISPRTPSLREIHALFRRTDDCVINPGNSCSGATLQDVIVNVDKDSGAARHAISLYINATKGAGGKITHEYNGLSFSGFIPEQVLALVEEHGKGVGLKVVRNGCMGIPWCGEAPC